jgi:outer membrane protein W
MYWITHIGIVLVFWRADYTGNRLIHSSTKIDIDPLITYLGVGYRF